ncbi:hypothetical protein L596_006462 [Steinernema carpocapsae]|uniref:Uncharacterized protein n=1 Tax=Steinernema carpocapsae TaxID=34508 RepID=A0A4U8V249_STECR|nr:hypothetical protein L596_006462 [Steinernema carpocapsae]
MAIFFATFHRNLKSRSATRPPFPVSLLHLSGSPFSRGLIFDAKIRTPFCGKIALCIRSKKSPIISPCFPYFGSCHVFANAVNLVSFCPAITMLLNRQYEIIPIPGRECLQRNFADYLKHGYRIGKEKYSFRRLTLNDRFTLLHRGFTLRAVVPEPSTASESSCSSNSEAEEGASPIKSVRPVPVEVHKIQRSVKVLYIDPKDQAKENDKSSTGKKTESTETEEAPKKEKKTRKPRYRKKGAAAKPKDDVRESSNEPEKIEIVVTESKNEVKVEITN